MYDVGANVWIPQLSQDVRLQQLAPADVLETELLAVDPIAIPEPDTLIEGRRVDFLQRLERRIKPGSEVSPVHVLRRSEGDEVARQGDLPDLVRRRELVTRRGRTRKHLEKLCGQPT